MNNGIGKKRRPIRQLTKNKTEKNPKLAAVWPGWKRLKVLSDGWAAPNLLDFYRRPDAASRDFQRIRADAGQARRRQSLPGKRASIFYFPARTLLRPTISRQRHEPANPLPASHCGSTPECFSNDARVATLGRPDPAGTRRGESTRRTRWQSAKSKACAIAS